MQRLRDRVVNAVLDRRVTIPLPLDRQAIIPENDVPDQKDARPDEISAWTIFIRYTDTKGIESQRRITCRRLYRTAGAVTSVLAYCHERRSPRRFVIANIADVVDMASGEILDAQSHFFQLAMSGLPIEDPALVKFTRNLVFLAKCDGEHHPLEWDAIEQGITSYALKFGGDDKDVEGAMKTAHALAPCGTDFIGGLKWIAAAKEGPQLSRLMLNTASSLIDADGKHSPEEIEWALPISEYLKRVAMRDR